ncbi:MAG: hypothetical protein WCS77_05345 [Elusimicrobiaceae bacterium]|jgi:hypothetical protein
MLKKLNNKGYALVLVLGIVVIMASTVASIVILMRGRASDLENILDRTTAYYLCETGASVAVLDIAAGKIKAGNTTRTFDFTIGDQSYKVRYVVKKVSGVWAIESSVASPLRLGATYTLKVGGQRAFPIFIKGFGGM